MLYFRRPQNPMKKDKKSQPLPETLKISVRNFGPIDEAKDIALRPLTIFVGPSNTGKSYMAVLAYSLLRTISEMFSSEEPTFSPRIRRILHLDEFTCPWESKIGPALMEAHRAFKESKAADESFKLPQEVLAFVHQMTAFQLRQLAAAWREDITRCMDAKWRELALKKESRTNRGLNLRVNNDVKSVFWHLGNVSVTSDTKLLSVNDASIFSAGEIGYFIRIFSRKEMPEFMLHEIADWSAGQLFSSEQITVPFYMPAARTGLMQSHQAISAAMVRSSSLAAVKPISVPALSGVLADFLEKLILLDTRKKTDLKSVADDLEKQVIKGTILVESPTRGYPHFSYAQNGVKIPLSRASSMVTELAPISLFLRHYVEKGNTIIVEEPEAHLHPEAQRGIAQMIVRLVRAGVRVIITTHSDYVLEQISNYIRLSLLGEDERKKFVSDGNLYLHREEVGAYLFTQPNRKGQGTKVRELPFDKDAGLAPDDHDAVSSALYNETVSIIERMPAK